MGKKRIGIDGATLGAAIKKTAASATAAAASAAQLAAGVASPAGTYANLDALIAANPDHSKTYITLDDGKWCYHNGTAFVAGGEYQSLTDVVPLKAGAFFEATNLVSNPGFESDLTGWSKNGTATATIDTTIFLDGTKSMKMAVASSSGEYFQAVAVPTGHVVYIAAWAYIESYTSGAPTIIATDYTASTNPVSFVIDVTKVAQWQLCYALKTSTDNGIRIKVTTGGIPATLEIVFDDTMVFDLTEMFGTGNEPGVKSFSKLLLDNYDNGWFSGSTSNFATVKKHAINKMLEPYQGKRVFYLGDSLVQIGDDPRGWIRYFEKIMLPISSVNVAVSGAHWCDYSDTSSYDGETFTGHQNVIGNQVQKIVNQAYAEPDIIIIAAGVNDNTPTETDANIEANFYDGSGMILLANADRQTFAGAIRWAVETLRATYPSVQVFLCTPLQNASTLSTYADIIAKNDVIKRIAKRVSVPVIDSLECGVYSNTGAWETAQGDYNDGLHLSPTGALKLGKYNALSVINWVSYDPVLLML
jgi:lysophospholipase L1-like esterase